MKGYFVSEVMKIIRKLDLTSKSISVYLYLAECSNANGECWPAKRTISKSCGISIPTVTRAIRELEKIGMVFTMPRHRLNNGQTSNRYTVFTEPQIVEQINLSSSQVALAEKPLKQETMNESLNPKTSATYAEYNSESHVRETSKEAPISTSYSYTLCNTNIDIFCTQSQPGDSLSLPVCEPTKSTATYTLSSTKVKAPKFRWLYAFCALVNSSFDTLPHINMIRHGTISTRKVTLKQRKEDLIFKLAKCILLYKHKFLRGTEIRFTKADDG